MASAQMPASWQAGLVTAPQAGHVPGVPPHTGTPAESILQLQHTTSVFHQPLKKPGSVPLHPLQPRLFPVLCCRPASPLLCPPHQAASAQLAGSSLCPLPFSEAQRAVPAWPQFNNARSHRTDPWQGCSPLTMPLYAWNGMQEAEVLLGRVSDPAVAAPWGPQEHTSPLAWSPFMCSVGLPVTPPTFDLGHPTVTSHQSGSMGR